MADSRRRDGAESPKRSEPVEVGDRIPFMSVPAPTGGKPIPLRRTGPHGFVLLLLHDPTCSACGDFVDRLSEEAAAISDWNGRVLVLQAEDRPGLPTEPRDIPFESAIDVGGDVSAGMGLRPPTVLIADQWGELHAVEFAGPDHEFVEPAEIVEWLKFMAIQCPECQGGEVGEKGGSL